MRAVLAFVAGTILMCAAAHAEKRIFIIANDSSGYGIDRCLAGGEKCGHAIATFYCKQREFVKAVSFQKVDRDDITGAIPVSKNNNCPKGNCEEFVAIECSR